MTASVDGESAGRVSISVVTVCFNAEDTIADTLASVAAQDWPHFEHILIDGGSTDRTHAIVEKLQHDRLKLICEPDDGIYDAMNKGLRHASCDYVGFLNADDFLASASALRTVAAVGRGEIGCVLGDTGLIDEHGIPMAHRYSAAGFRPWWLTIGAMPPHPSFYARRDLLLEAGGFDTSYRVSADFDLIARLILKHAATWSVAGKTLAFFRFGGVSTRGIGSTVRISRDKARSLRALGYRAPEARSMLRFPLRLWRKWFGADRRPEPGVDARWFRPALDPRI